MRIGGNNLGGRFVAHIDKTEMNSSRLNSASFSAKKNADTLTLSDTGQRLRFRSKETVRTDGKNAKTFNDPSLKLMKDSIANVGALLEQMENLALLAQNSNLTALDRIDLQIEMEKLSRELAVAMKKMSLKTAGISERGMNELFAGSNLSGANEPENTGQENVGLLARARSRILNGEKWDVGEILEVEYKVCEVRAGDRSFQVENWEDFELPADVDADAVLLKFLEKGSEKYKYVTTGDNDVPTVRQRLEKENTLILMDTKSAGESAGRLEREIESFTKIRDEFVALYEKKTGINSFPDESVRLNASGPATALQKGRNEKPGAQSALGWMEYSMRENGTTPDMTDPRLVRSNGPVGDFFMKLEHFFKDQIAPALGIPVKYKLTCAMEEYAGPDGLIKTTYR